MADLATIKKALEVWPHQSLYGIATAEPEKPLDRPKPAAERVKNTVSDTQMPLLSEFTEDERLLAFNIVTSLFVPYKQRGIELKFSMRRLEKAADSLVSREMIKQVSISRNIFLAPTEKLYQYLSMASPYKRNISVEHSFSVLFARWCIDGDPAVHKTVIEAPIDSSGKTGDMIAYLKNGDRHIYEITLNNSNCASNAAKVRGKGFSMIIFVCRDHNIRKATQIILGDAGFEPEFFSTIECVLFSDLIHAKAERSK